MHWTQHRENLSGLYDTKLISEVIQDTFFKNNRAIGVEFQRYFNLITLVTIAFVLTAICISDLNSNLIFYANLLLD
jgi:hypothetical protein